MITDGRVALNADDCSPMTGPVLVFTFLYLSHLLKPLVVGFGRLAGGAGKDCFSLHRHWTAEAILNLIFGFQSSYSCSQVLLERWGNLDLNQGPTGYESAAPPLPFSS